MKGMDLLKFCFSDKIIKSQPHLIMFDFGKGITAEVRDVLDTVSFTLYINGKRYKKKEWLSSQKENGYNFIAIELKNLESILKERLIKWIDV